MAKFILEALQIVLLVLATKACNFKTKQQSPQELRFPGPWYDESTERDLGSCECGKSVPGKIPPWNIYIHVSTDNKTLICSGTIITSNLIATSHECIRAPGKKLHNYDAWNISQDYKGFVKLNEIKLTSSINANAGETFPVLELIPNPHYLVSWDTKFFHKSHGYKTLDLLLLKVKADFTKHKDHSPICIPEESNYPEFDVQMGYYYSGDENISHAIHEGLIYPRKWCEDVINNDQGYRRKKEIDELSGLCFEWVNQFSAFPPGNAGGPLILKSKSQNSYLAGIACDVTPRAPGNWTDYAYFSNIIPMIKYLEYRARQHKSNWCKTPPLEPEALRKPPTEPPVWPWEMEPVQQTFKLRNESLNCVPNTPNGASGRIAGGVSATPFEFGWMVGLDIYPKGKGRESIFCGGSIINNRMILTAANCLNIIRQVVTKPENVVVKINMHYRQGDRPVVTKEVQKVIVHPNYILENYKWRRFDNDIALLLLKDEQIFPPLSEGHVKKPTANLRPICIPKMGETMSLEGKQAMVSGWGYIDPVKKTLPDTLQKLEVPILAAQDCLHPFQPPITENHLCAGSKNRSKDAAAGDTGGPLSIMRGRQWTQVGILSWAHDEFAYDENRTYVSTATVYVDLTKPAILPIIDYFAVRVGAQWCKSEIS